MIANVLRVWKRGFVLALVYGVGVLVVGAAGAVPLLTVNEMAAVGGWGLPVETVLTAWLWLAWLWAPLGLGFADHYLPAKLIRPIT